MCPICGLDTLRSHDQVHCEHMAAGIWNVPALCALGKLHLLFTNNCNVFSMYLMGKLPLAASVRPCGLVVLEVGPLRLVILGSATVSW